MKLLNVAVLMGGVSPEHDISLRSGATLLTHLSEARYRTRAVVILKDGTWAGAEGRPSLEEIRSLSRGERPEIALAALRDWGLDAAVLALHGPNGEDGSIQGLLQSAGIPYTGSGVEASAVCMNKHLAKLMAARTGVLLAPASILARGEYRSAANHVIMSLSKSPGFPLFVKPLRSGSSMGVSCARDGKQLREGLHAAFSVSEEVMVEKGIEGREITCGVLGSLKTGYRALPLVEIKPKESSFFDTESKYDGSKTDEICPAPLGDPVRIRIEKAACAVARQIGTRGVVRVDFILRDEGIWFLEVNTIPGFTRESIVLKEARAAGLSLESLVDELVEDALRHNPETSLKSGGEAP